MISDTTRSFTLAGGYQFASAFDLQNDTPFIFAQAGRITGAFAWTFEDGVKARTHVNGATANRVTSAGGEIFGTMQMNMYEADGSAPGSALLFLAYEGDVEARGTMVVVRVRGRFIGGTGRYEGARGSVTLTSVNGYFDDGRGTLVLGGAAEADHRAAAVPESDVRAAVEAYFEATRSGDAAVWAGRFAEGAVVEDPMGAPPLTTPEAIRAQGERFLSAFEEVGLYPDFVHVSGRRAAAKWTGRGVTTDGRRVEFEGINVFTFAPDGRVLILNGYFDPPTLREGR